MRVMGMLWAALLLAASICAGFTHGSLPPNTQDVLTHFYDTSRTGWNQNETTLNTTNVAGAHFGVVCSRTDLDARIDTQPLIVMGLTIAGGTHNVLYLATENDTVYALDADTCATLVSASLGTAVPNDSTIGCGNDNSTMGVGSTPVIDASSNTMYLISYTEESGQPVFRIHALNLATLTDKLPSQVIANTVLLSDNTTVYSFLPPQARQRAALLLSQGRIWAGFSSYCDHNNHTLRGWVMSWNIGTLTRNTSFLTNAWATDPTGANEFLTSVWMSGAGIAADASGNVYFSTGNSASSAGSPPVGFSPPTNFQDTVAKFSPTGTMLDYFAETNLIFNDANDLDFASGGVVLLPDQPGSAVHMAAIVGKAGVLYLINRDNMGHWNASTPQVLDFTTFASCWCSINYFKGPDGVPRIVVPGGVAAGIIQINTSTDKLGTQTSTASMPGDADGQDEGFFSTVSSNGTVSGTAVLWALARPSSTVVPTLFAFDAISGATLYNHVAGQWTNLQGNENTVPVVSHGQVYVATDQQLYVFGITP